MLTRISFRPPRVRRIGFNLALPRIVPRVETPSVSVYLSACVSVTQSKCGPFPGIDCSSSVAQRM